MGIIDTKRLEALLEEVNGAVAAAEDELRGLEKYLLLPLRVGTLVEVEALQARYQRRVGLMCTLARGLSNAIGCVQTVLDDGYPPVSEVSADVAEDLARNLADLGTARSVPAASLGRIWRQRGGIGQAMGRDHPWASQTIAIGDIDEDRKFLRAVIKAIGGDSRAPPR